MQLKDCRLNLEKKKAVKEDLQQRLNSSQTNLKDLKKKQNHSEKALLILQKIAKETQQILEYRISEIATLALEAVFPNPYKVRLKYEIKRNKTEAALLFERNGNLCDPLDESGGGAVDVAAFALKIALWSLQNPRSDNTIILDEPFKMLSKKFIPKAGQMLKELSQRLGLQLIMVTHLTEMVEAIADKTFDVTLHEDKDGWLVSKVEESN